MRELVLLALCGFLLVLTATGCESTETESARLGHEGAKLIASTGTLGLGATNQSVRVDRTALVQGAGRTAAVVQLTDTGEETQANVPVLIDVLDPKGRSVYSNDIQGLEPSLQEMPLLRAHQRAWWVDDQVLASGTASSVKVRVGAAKAGEATASGHSAPAGHVAASGSSLARDAVSSAGVQASIVSVGNGIAGPYLNGTVANHSGVARRNMPVFAVGLRGGRVVAAGRALVPTLPASTGAHPTNFRIYLVGSPAGARFELTPAPAMTQ